LSSIDWRGQFESAVGESLASVEREWANPTGAKGWIRGGLVLLANIVPEVTFIAAVLMLLWNYFMTKDFQPTLGSVFLPVLLTLAVLVLFHMLIHWLLPLRWPTIRNDFLNALQAQVRDRLHSAYAVIPDAVASDMTAERAAVDRIAVQVGDLRELLESRRLVAKIDSLYGAGPPR
jgi:ABC-type protease/lipase transport system fused ATPase/permease subunit